MAAAQRVLITGASRGFGRALTDASLANGAVVFALVRRPADAEALAAGNPAGCVPVVGDVCDIAVGAAIRAAVDAHGGSLDLLVNNAGGPGRGMRLEQLEASDLVSQFELHCVGAMRCARAALPFLESSDGGLVVNVSSRLGSLAKNAGGDFSLGAFSYDYRIAKAAQNMLTLCLSQEFSPRGVSVCAIHPGRLKTRTGSCDAEIDPADAAARLLPFVAHADGQVSGRFFDLFDGEISW